MKNPMTAITSIFLTLALLAGCTGIRPSTWGNTVPSPAPTVQDPAEGNKGGVIGALEDIPVSYTQEAGEQGQVVKVDYTTTDYTRPDQTLEKYAYVYLPYGFDAADSTTRYDILYLLHGGGGNAERYFGGEGQSSEFKRILDNLIQNGDLRPMLVVTPTFYPIGNTDASVSNAEEAVKYFPDELVNDLIPAVESAYPTYAETADAAGLQASRDHRGFGGFSMGSVATWYVFMDCLDYFHYFLPMSGDCWALGQRAGGSDPARTAQAVAQALTESGYSTKDFFIHALTGDEDIAYSSLAPQMEAMKEIDGFTFDPDTSKGNAWFSVVNANLKL